MMKPLTCGIHSTNFIILSYAISEFRLYRIGCNYRFKSYIDIGYQNIG